MKPTLFILAAGMGSRYGGLKQLDGVGPNGETIMDYSVYDAIRAGFGKIVFVIRHDFEDDFRSKVIAKYVGKIDIEVCFQSLDSLPDGFVCPQGRVKPWGTNHAVLMGKDVINEPFAVINADDFYGRDAFAVLGEYLAKMSCDSATYCMVGYHIENTLSESGGVNRGVCAVDSNGYLTDIKECCGIEKRGEAIEYVEDGKTNVIDSEALVSMNMWGFAPNYFGYSNDYFVEFLKQNIDKEKAEFYIPTMVNHLIVNGVANVEVLSTSSKWFGVTYADDRASVVERLNKLVEQGEYPTPLFKG